MAQITVDPSSLEQLGSRLLNNSQQIDQLARDIENAVQGANWKGNAYNNFKGVWDTQRQNVTQLTQSLQQVKTALDQWKQAMVDIDNQGFRA